MKKGLLIGGLITLMLCTACSANKEQNTPTENFGGEGDSNVYALEKEEVKDISDDSEEKEEEGKSMIKVQKGLKTRGNTNPIITQDFGADPYAMSYGDTLYFYMTADSYEEDTEGNVKDNSYSKIKHIRVVSTKDMKNFTDHGLIPVAGKDGIATWASNSWAPAACWKNIDGKDKFFLYFADNGGGIGVLEADSPVGPFTDPLGHGLITRDMKGCEDVLWLFDPAVLVDDDGNGYIYFGGGVPEGKIANPSTGRCAKLTDDMIGIEGEPVLLDAPYLFEDSGIHKYKDKYYYSYCTNWNVDEEGTAKYGFVNAEIAVMESDNPLGPFTYKETVLSNPGTICGLYGNNHHCIFSFNDKWYITYHSRALEKSLGVEKGYRNTCIDEFEMAEDGTIGRIRLTNEGPDQLEFINPYSENEAVCAASIIGLDIVSQSDEIAYGKMAISNITDGGYVEVDGVDFGDKEPAQILFNVKLADKAKGKIHVRFDLANSEDIAVAEIEGSNETRQFSATVNQNVSGVHYMFLVFEGEGITLNSWNFE